MYIKRKGILRIFIPCFIIHIHFCHRHQLCARVISEACVFVLFFAIFLILFYFSFYRKPTVAHVQQQRHSQQHRTKMARRRRKKEPRKVSYKVRFTTKAKCQGIVLMIPPFSPSFQLYVRRVLKEVHPGKEISMRALNIMNSWVAAVAESSTTSNIRFPHFFQLRHRCLGSHCNGGDAHGPLRPAQDRHASRHGVFVPTVPARHHGQTCEPKGSEDGDQVLRCKSAGPDEKDGDATWRICDDADGSAVSTLNFWTTAGWYHLYIVDDCSYIPRMCMYYAMYPPPSIVCVCIIQYVLCMCISGI